MAALWRPLMVKFLILILTKSYFLVLRNNALTFVFFVIVIHELHGIVECVVLISLLKEGKGRGQLGFAARKASSRRLRVTLKCAVPSQIKIHTTYHTIQAFFGHPKKTQG